MTQAKHSINGALAKTGADSSLGSLAKLMLDALLPPQCLSCGAIVEGHGLLCPTCWDEVVFLSPPCCDACGLPFEYDPGEGVLCGACCRQRPVFQRARSVMAYDTHSRRLILTFKHGDRTDAAPALGRWLLRAGSDLIADADLVAPVPLHWTRLFIRRFNQAALLARALRRRAGPPVVLNLLIRHRRTPSQGRLGPALRRRNVRGAFALRSSMAREIKGKRVLLIDDVLTTGATVSACARTLLAGGAEAVDVLTLARVIRSV